MKKIVSVLALVCVLMVVIAGSGAFLLSNIFISKSKVDAVVGVAKGLSITLSEQVGLLNNMLDKMVQDPELIEAAAQKNQELVAVALKKLENHFPGVVTVKIMLPENTDADTENAAQMGFADFDMAKRTFTENQVSAIQGNTADERHLAIARKLVRNGLPVGVVLVGLNYNFVKRIVDATNLDKGYIELRQGTLVLASTGDKSGADDVGDDPINVPNTDWHIYFENSGSTSIGEYSLMLSIILIPAMAVALGFATGYRKLTGLLSEEMAWLTKAFKDIVTDKPLGDYPVKLGETRSLITTLAQFKRIVNDKWFDA